MANERRTLQTGRRRREAPSRAGCSNASGRLSPPALMVRSQAGSGLRGSIWGPRLPPPSPSLTSQRRLQSTNAVYWGGSPPSGASQWSRLRRIMDANPSFRAAAPFAIFESFPACDPWQERRRWGRVIAATLGWAAASCRLVAGCDVFSGSCRRAVPVCAAECH